MHLSPEDLDALTDGRSLCDADGEIGPAEVNTAEMILCCLRLLNVLIFIVCLALLYVFVNALLNFHYCCFPCERFGAYIKRVGR